MEAHFVRVADGHKIIKAVRSTLASRNDVMETNLSPATGHNAPSAIPVLLGTATELVRSPLLRGSLLGYQCIFFHPIVRLIVSLSALKISPRSHALRSSSLLSLSTTVSCITLC